MPEDKDRADDESMRSLEIEFAAKRTEWKRNREKFRLLRLLTNLNLWTLCLMYFCAAYGWYFNITWLPGYLTRQYGVESRVAWLDGLHQLPAMTSDAWLKEKAGALISNQRSDKPDK